MILSILLSTEINRFFDVQINYPWLWPFHTCLMFLYVKFRRINDIQTHFSQCVLHSTSFSFFSSLFLSYWWRETGSMKRKRDAQSPLGYQSAPFHRCSIGLRSGAAVQCLLFIHYLCRYRYVLLLSCWRSHNLRLSLLTLSNMFHSTMTW